MGNVRWRVIHVAKNPDTAKRIQQLLESEGFVARIHPLNAEGAAGGLCEVKVLSAEAEEAFQLLMEHSVTIARA